MTPGSSDISDFSTRLRNSIRKLNPTPAARHTKEKIFIFRDLNTESNDSIGRPPEAGLRIVRFFPCTLEPHINSNTDPIPTPTVPTSSTLPHTTLSNVKKTRTGRVVRCPDYYRP
ncbi:unnamed protein product [Euphydryas editha]|uniref:Uncharacterized protein n=1 Tax=Euphydryas editha TaxID=104508 RepID=A0AAU9TLF6_EUPED|nr:unnamed protein product [Euphydryas editha]